jgi:hypothetical protein
MATHGVVSLTVPAGREFSHVVRLVLGGIGSRVDLPIDDVDDVQLAVAAVATTASKDELLVEAQIEDEHLIVRIGPVGVDLARDPGLVRVLAPLVDRFEQADGDTLGTVVVLEKKRRPARSV